jgi:hypothetical protein
VNAGDRVTFNITPNPGYTLLSVTGATKNADGSYTTDYIFGGTTVTVQAAASLDLGANCASGIGVYSEGVHTGVRINLDESKYPLLNNIPTNGYYGLTINGQVLLTIGGVSASVSANQPYNYFGVGHGSLFEIRFDTSKLQKGDTFTIKAGTTFTHNNLSYMIHFTEDFVGLWTGSAWINPTKMGELNWSTISRIESYSDVSNGQFLNYTIRITLSNGIFNDATNYNLFVSGDVTINGAPYTGSWTYLGGGNRILQLSNWNYKAGDKLVIKAGTKIYMDSLYYDVTETLTAICTADGRAAAWNWIRTSTPKLGEIDWSTVGNIGTILNYSDLDANGQKINSTIRIFLNDALFGGVQQNHTIFAMDGVTLNGNAYVGTWTYHGGGNMILQIDTWNYKSGDVLVIAAGSKICTPTGYYEVTKTLTATCTSNDNYQTWTFTVS